MGAETGDGRARILLKTKVDRLLTDKDGNVCGCECTSADGKKFQEHGPVIIATGGFGADFSQDSLLNKHRPDLAHLPTTNGDHCTVDGRGCGVRRPRVGASPPHRVGASWRAGC